MTRTTPPQVAMSSGEIDPLLAQRFDYQRYQTGLAKCRGFLPLVQGGFTRAPGTIFRGEAAGACVLVPFVFAANDAVILEFSANLMRVWRYGQLVTAAGGGVYSLATPYGADSLSRLRWVQSADVIYLCDGLQPVQRLARAALNSWSIAPQVFDNGPFRVQNLATGYTLQASGPTGSITLTASLPFFNSDHVGCLIQLKPSDNTALPLWIADQPITVGEKRRYGGKIYELVDDLSIGGTTKNTGLEAPVHTEGVEQYSPGRTWRYLGDDTGIVRITSVVSSTSAVATVLRRVPDGCVASPTYRWSEGAWDRYGYPSQIAIYDQRLVLAANSAEPRTVWFSAVGDYTDFRPGTEADEAFPYTIAGQGSVNAIQNLCRGRTGLHIFALGEEYSTRSESRAQVIGPTTAVFSLDGSVGSSPARPIAPAGDPIIISRDKRRVLQVAYSMEMDGNQTANLTRVAQHLGADGFEEIVWQGAPEPIAWLRQTTGNLVAMLMDKSEDVLGFAQVTLAGGVVEAMAVCPSADGSQDVVTLCVRRVINGVTRRFIEELALPFPALGPNAAAARAVHFFASSLFAPSSPTASFHVPQFTSASVYAWTDQGGFGPLAVNGSGVVTLPVPVSRACIGLFDDSHHAETLDIVAQAPNGSSMGRGKKLTGKVGIGLHATAQGYVQGIERSFGGNDKPTDQKRIVQSQAGRPFATALSGITQIDLSTGTAPQVALRFTPFSGAPMTVTAIIPDIQETGG